MAPTMIGIQKKFPSEKFYQVGKIYPLKTNLMAVWYRGKHLCFSPSLLRAFVMASEAHQIKHVKLKG